MCLAFFRYPHRKIPVCVYMLVISLDRRFLRNMDKGFTFKNNVHVKLNELSNWLIIAEQKSGESQL